MTLPRKRLALLILARVVAVRTTRGGVMVASRDGLGTAVRRSARAIRSRYRMGVGRAYPARHGGRYLALAGSLDPRPVKRMDDDVLSRDRDTGANFWRDRHTGWSTVALIVVAVFALGAAYYFMAR